MMNANAADVSTSQSIPAESHTNLAIRGEPASVSSTSQTTPAARQPKTARPCRFFSSKNGCRAGTDCPFLHESTQAESTTNAADPTIGQGRAPEPSALSASARARIVAKPTPQKQLDDPREFQMGQVRRRFKPTELRHGSSTHFGIKMKPSDPDFPFEIELLDCVLMVPQLYPKEHAALKVKNSDIPRGFAINIENGFAALAERAITLLALMTALDRNLEEFLTEKKVETVKLVANADRRHLETTVTSVVNGQQSTSMPSPSTNKVIVASPEPSFTPAQRADAAKRRGLEARQLEARLGRQPLFTKSADGVSYTLPIEPRRRAELPANIRAIRTITLVVPSLYPLRPCRILLRDFENPEARAVETNFEADSAKSPETNLMGHLNSLSQNMHQMAVPPRATEEKEKTANTTTASPAKHTMTPVVKQLEAEGTPLDDRTHIRVIPRPPEWDVAERKHDSDSDDDTDDFTDEESADDDAASDDEMSLQGSTAPQASQLQQSKPEIGTALSFPFLELYGVELLELHTLNLIVKCERCKEQNELLKLHDDAPRTEHCRKCAVQLTVTYHKELLHTHNARAGLLDFEGCFPLDMLPSTFIPTCASCSTPWATPGLTATHGDPTRNICRTCHHSLVFTIPSTKFLRISSNISHSPATVGPRRKKEVLGLVAGQELPRRGRCTHYAKSYRWFRFSCCQKVYACDRCHDAAETHELELAKRMVCGFCSREQNFRASDCGVCHAELVGRKGGGFWEGGKGTRDRVRMSRKDKRKYRNRPI